MAKISPELSRKRGERVKALLKEKNMRQADLADLINFTPEHLNAILNGKRNLTLETAKDIARIFSNVRYEWILCEDNFKTEDEKLASILKWQNGPSELLEQLFWMHGYQITGMTDGVSIKLQFPPDISDEEILRRAHETPPIMRLCIKSPNGATRYIEQEDFWKMLKSIDDYAEFVFSRCFTKIGDLTSFKAWSEMGEQDG